jgi:hypothetical protein
MRIEHGQNSNDWVFNGYFSGAARTGLNDLSVPDRAVWNHIAIVYNNGTITSYVNGALSDTKTNTGFQTLANFQRLDYCAIGGYKNALFYQVIMSNSAKDIADEGYVLTITNTLATLNGTS